MTQIYNKVVKVYVWIGQHEGNSELGINLTNEFRDWVATGGKSNEDLIPMDEAEIVGSEVKKLWEGLWQVLERSY